MNPHRRKKFREVEEAYGMPFWDVVQMLANRGLAKTRVAELVGYSEYHFSKLLRSPEAPAINWAPLSVRRRQRELSQEALQNIREATRRQDRVIWLTINGETKTLTDWAREIGVSPGCLRRRYHQGWQDILRPPMSRQERGRWAISHRADRS